MSGHGKSGFYCSYYLTSKNPQKICGIRYLSNCNKQSDLRIRLLQLFVIVQV